MRTLRKTIFRKWAVMALVFLMGMGLIGFSPIASAQDCSPESDNAVPDGCTLQPGTLALFEGSAWPDTWLYAGYVPDNGFTVNRAAGLNAWSGYDSFEETLDGACRTAEVRPTANGGGFSGRIFVNDQPYTGMDNCMGLQPYGRASSGNNNSDESSSSQPDQGNSSGNDPVNDAGDNLRVNQTVEPRQEEQDDDGLGEDGNMTVAPGFYTQELMDQYGIVCRPALGFAQPNEATGTSQGSIYDNEPMTEVPDLADSAGTGLAVPPPECISQGIVIVRAVVYGPGAWEDISVYELDGSGDVVVCGKQGTAISYDCWESYPSIERALFEACDQVMADRMLIEVPGSYLYRGTITFMDGPLPAACK